MTRFEECLIINTKKLYDYGKCISEIIVNTSGTSIR